MRADSQAGIVAPKIRYHDSPDTIWYAGGMVQMWSGMITHRGIREIDRGQYDSPCETDFATGCCALISRNVVDRVGVLDESYSMYAEDVDLSWRARRAGYRILYEPRAVVWHKVSFSAGGNLSGFKLKHKFFSTMRFFSRHARWYHWPFWPWLSILFNGAKGVLLLVQQKRS
jgi:hypothetical protein